MKFDKRMLSPALVRSFYIVFAAIGFLFSLIIPVLWHAKFYGDGVKILSSVPSLGLFGNSFQATALLLYPINEWMMALFGWDEFVYDGNALNIEFIFINLIYAMIFWFLFYYSSVSMFRRWSTVAAMHIAFVLVFFSVYYALVSKEIVVVLIASLVAGYAARCRIRLALFVWLMFMLFYGATVRIYFLLFAVVFISNYWLLFRRNYFTYTFVVISGLALFYFFLDYEWVRALMTKGRAEDIQGFTATYLHLPFEDDKPLFILLNRAASFFMISFPVHLLVISPVYALYVMFQIFTTFIMFWSIFARVSNVGKIAGASVFSFTIVQSIFEPDFGSVLRHKIMVMPFITLLVLEWTRSGSWLYASRLKSKGNFCE